MEAILLHAFPPDLTVSTTNLYMGAAPINSSVELWKGENNDKKLNVESYQHIL